MPLSKDITQVQLSDAERESYGLGSPRQGRRSQRLPLTAATLEELAESAHAELDVAERAVGQRLTSCRALARFMQAGATALNDEAGDEATYTPPTKEQDND